jgi:methyltransferase (TIGR00027 family)
MAKTGLMPQQPSAGRVLLDENTLKRDRVIRTYGGWHWRSLINVPRPARGHYDLRVGEDVQGPSRTAILSAVARAVHREEPAPWVIYDYLALPLAGQEGLALLDRMRAQVPQPYLLAFSRWMCVRARFAEDIAEQAATTGTAQYVILGAGLDSFAYRRGDLLRRLRVFEVDHPATQAWKRRRLAELGVQLPAGLVFAPVDFERQTLREGLAQAGFGFGQLAVVSWLGVTMYLTLDAIRATLATLAGCQPGTRVVLTYNQPTAVLTGSTAQIAATFAALAADMGEPFLSRLLPTEIAQLLHEHGFGQITDFGPDQARAAYFPKQADVEIAGAQRLIAATVTSAFASNEISIG